MNINGFSNYVSDGISVFTKVRQYPLASSVHPTKKYRRFFMVDDSGIERVVSARYLKNIVVRPSSPVETKSRGKRVLHRSTGAIYGSIKAAAEATGTSVAKVKSNADFEILI